jgi:transcriptional regulator with XRE-family HTH domain
MIHDPAATDRRTVTPRFRERLLAVMARSELTQSGFARAAGIDRSTLSQLLAADGDRLPRLESAVRIARLGGVSLDWLCGLTQREQPGAEVLSESLRIEQDAPGPLDERLVRWLEEAAGYRIRHVPTTLPDALKTEAVIAAEYGRYLTLSPQRSLEITQARLAYLRRPETEMEACAALQTIEALAQGADIFRGVPARARRAQLEHMAALCEALYPRFRLFLYDRRQIFSVPLTVFGPLRAAVYLGQSYFVFRSVEHIRVLAEHFDRLVRAAVVQPTEIARTLNGLAAGIR